MLFAYSASAIFCSPCFVSYFYWGVNGKILWGVMMANTFCADRPLQINIWLLITFPHNSPSTPPHNSFLRYRINVIHCSRLLAIFGTIVSFALATVAANLKFVLINLARTGNRYLQSSCFCLLEVESSRTSNRQLHFVGRYIL